MDEKTRGKLRRNITA